MSVVKKQKIVAVDLFCGVGGLTNGLVQAGIKVLVGYDIDKSVEYAYSKNNGAKFIYQDITLLSGEDIKKVFLKQSKKSKTLIAGCAPCQPFSVFQKDKSSEAKMSHYSYPAFEHFARIVCQVMPDYVTMENVRGITRDANFIQLIFDLRKNGYDVFYEVVNIAHYGAPQNRKRLILLASRHGTLRLPLKTVQKVKNVKQAIGHLPPIAAGEKNQSDKLHFSSRLSAENMLRIKASRPGGTWEDWPKELLPDCYKKLSGQTFKTVYGRLNPDKPANTITTQFNRYGTGRYGHYSQNRALSLREGAILQTFPDDYDFGAGFIPMTKIARHIGNAVPPIVGKIIGNILTSNKAVNQELWKKTQQKLILK